MLKGFKALAIISVLFLLQAQAKMPLQAGFASYYSRIFEGRRTANGERFSNSLFTAAHRTLPFGTMVEVKTCDERRKVVVRINDRGPYHQGRIIDLSYLAFATLAPIGQGIICVKLSIVSEKVAKMLLLSDSPYHIACDDSITFLKQLPSQSVNLIATDPAYASLEKHRAIGTTTRLKEWFDIFPNELYPAFLAECYRVMKKNSHMYILCDEETADILKPLCDQAGFTRWPSNVFSKIRRGTGYHYPRSHEWILFLEKGKRKLNTNNYLSVMEHESVRGLVCGEKKYPTEKPVSLMAVLISESTSPGEIVLDPFMGSASTGEAALLLGRRFLGSDTSQKALDRSERRLHNVLFPPISFFLDHPDPGQAKKQPAQK